MARKVGQIIVRGDRRLLSIPEALDKSEGFVKA